MYSLILLQVFTLVFNIVIYQSISTAEQLDRYEVVMYSGVPPESYPEEQRKKLPPEKSILVASIAMDGRFQAMKKGAAMEGIITILEDGRLKVIIKESKLNSTSGGPIETIVRPGETIDSKGAIFSSIIFLYYFRVQKAAEGKKAQGTTSDNRSQRMPRIILPIS